MRRLKHRRSNLHRASYDLQNVLASREIPFVALR
jgi:hypothetical protein